MVDLEHATKELSGYLVRDFSQTNGNLTEMKQKVQDKYRYCSKRQKVFLDHAAEGYERDYWLVFIYYFQYQILTNFIFLLCSREYNEDV